MVTTWPGLVFFRYAVNCSTLATGVPSTASKASPAFSLPADGPGSLTVAAVTADGYFKYPNAAYSALSSEFLKSVLLALSTSSRDFPGG